MNVDESEVVQIYSPPLIWLLRGWGLSRTMKELSEKPLSECSFSRNTKWNGVELISFFAVLSKLLTSVVRFCSISWRECLPIIQLLPARTPFTLDQLFARKEIVMVQRYVLPEGCSIEWHFLSSSRDGVQLRQQSHLSSGVLHRPVLVDLLFYP
jgi:hypothetical protein